MDIELNEEQKRKALEQFILNNPELEKIEGMLSDFNVFETLDIVNVEIRHSNVLAWLFDPIGSHGLGTYFVQKFIKRFVNENKTNIEGLDVFDLEMFDFTSVEIRREYRKIDLLILFEEEKSNIVIAIENKVGSSEHGDQLERYYNIVNEEFKNYIKLFIFFTPEYTPPSHEAWIPYSYNSITSLLDQILKYRKDSLAEPIQEFINHYNIVLKRYIVGNSEIEKICKQIYKKHKPALDLIFKYKPDILNDISEYLQQLIRESEDTCIFDSAGKTVIRFSTPNFEKLIPKVSEGWVKSKRILLYEFYNYDKRLVLNLYVGPGDQNLRDRIYSITSQERNLFNYAHGKLHSKWKCLYQLKILKQKDFDEGDFEEMKEKITKSWNKFLKDDKVEIDNYFQKNWV